MESLSVDVDRRLKEYSRRYGRQAVRQLGWGVHGTVFSSKVYSGVNVLRSALKVHERVAPYQSERDVYLRLKSHQVSEIRGCNVPELVHFDDDLYILEMTIVERPFVLDFAGAYLDRPPDFSDEVMAEWREEKQDQFGADWGEVELILAHLERYGIFLSDISLNNISFGPVE